MTETDEKTEKSKDKGKGKGTLNLTDLILFGLGNIVGAGIFIIIGKSIKTQYSYIILNEKFFYKLVY